MDKNRRLLLDSQLKAICSHVYFQPPESVRMQYPAIRYSRMRPDEHHADDIAYMRSDRYQVIVIDKDPDSAVAEALSNFPKCALDRTYAADNLNHFVFELYY